ncbi:hypothetical protein FHT44_004976 [Mycolicibacterium sp. BK634]|nr:hypothetical protein [Mycolicibacterium sp. BK634]
MTEFFGPNGERWTRKQFLDFCFSYNRPALASVMNDQDVCVNCWCTDCGCCQNCGAKNADLESNHTCKRISGIKY